MHWVNSSEVRWHEARYEWKLPQDRTSMARCQRDNAKQRHLCMLSLQEKSILRELQGGQEEATMFGHLIAGLVAFLS